MACSGVRPTCPPAFEGWDFYTAYSQALAPSAGRATPLVVGNDGALGVVGEGTRGGRS